MLKLRIVKVVHPEIREDSGRKRTDQRKDVGHTA